MKNFTEFKLATTMIMLLINESEAMTMREKMMLALAVLSACISTGVIVMAVWTMWTAFAYYITTAEVPEKVYFTKKQMDCNWELTNEQ